MNLFRIVFVAGCVLALAGASYLSYKGIWGESRDLDTSVRTGSPGGGYYTGGRIK